MAILLGSVTEGEKHVPPGHELESGRYSDQSGLRLGFGGKKSVAFDRCYRKSLFALLMTNSPSRRRGDLTNVWGRHQKAMSSPATSVTGLGVCRRTIVRVFRLSAGNWSQSSLGLFRQHRPEADLCLFLIDVRFFREDLGRIDPELPCGLRTASHHRPGCIG